MEALLRGGWYESWSAFEIEPLLERSFLLAVPFIFPFVGAGRLLPDAGALRAAGGRLEAAAEAGGFLDAAGFLEAAVLGRGPTDIAGDLEAACCC
mgnify:CR=1 FL=1